METVTVAKMGKPKTAAAVKARPPKNKTKYFVGIDLHKKFMQVAVMNPDGKVLHNDRIECDRKTVRSALSKIPRDAKYVPESSSVWYGMYRFLTNELGLDVLLSNPLATKRIAESKKKTDRVDAMILADLLRGGYIAGCYVPGEETVRDRQLVRYRAKMVEERTRFKNMVHGILLQEGIRIPGQTFSPEYNRQLRQLGNWRIDRYLRTIDFLNRDVAECSARIQKAVEGNRRARLLKTMPGIGDITALALASEIDDISRFPDMDRLASYFGLVPSVRNSAGTVHHGGITKAGASLVRQLLTEAALVHVATAKRKKAQTPISVFYERLAKKRGGSKAKVATAAKMPRIAFWMLKEEIDFGTCMSEGRKSTRRRPRGGGRAR